MKSFQITSPTPGQSFAVGSIIEGNGEHSLELNSFVWVVLQDIYRHYYLQNPPVALHADGSWQAKNLHWGPDIIEIIFGQVNQSGHKDFLQKVGDYDWSAFDVLPTRTEKPGSVRVKVN